MVRVLHVLHVELPVVGQGLGEAADDLYRLSQHARQALEDLGAEVVLDRRRVRGQGAEHEPAHPRRAQLAGPVRLEAEGRRHPALAVDTLLEGDPTEVAPTVVAPGVVDALELALVAAVLEADQRAAMGAAVLEGVDLAVGVPRHHHGHQADVRGAVVARARDVRLQAEEVPDRPLEDATLLGAEHLGILIHPVGHAREGLARPHASRADARIGDVHGMHLLDVKRRAATSLVRGPRSPRGGRGLRGVGLMPSHRSTGHSRAATVCR